jgi:hypothetical protein
MKQTEEYDHLGCNGLYFRDSLCCRGKLPQSSRLRSKPSNKLTEAGCSKPLVCFCCFLLLHVLLPWRWRQYVALKGLVVSRLQSITTQSLQWVKLKMAFLYDSRVDSCFTYKASTVGALSLRYIFTQKIDGCFTFLIMEAHSSLYLSLSLQNFVYLYPQEVLKLSISS